ncbi:HD domain-containing protein [bacterium]|nr:HD domain-containing protein [bacterium]
MKLEFTKLVTAISRATDFVEAEILHIPLYHEKRVGILANAMGKAMGMDEETVNALTLAGALHDCALSEYLKDEYPDGGYQHSEINFASHCVTGERMLNHFPFYKLVEGSVLHHHDRADGTGALGATAENTCVYGQILHITDLADAVFLLDAMDEEKYHKMMQWMDEHRGTAFTDEMVDVFKKSVTYELLESITGERCIAVLDSLVPSVSVEVPMSVMRTLSIFFAQITDYKSQFTWRHSLGIAEKAELMGKFYGYDREMRDKLYIAGALHDIGKLLISNDILEKPSKLTDEEYKVIQNHAMGTWELLKGIGGLEDICRWASLHHEKLDGSGYPFGYKADKIGRHERLIACLDIYQALVEERPYKKGMTHEAAMEILRKLVNEGHLDGEIIDDIDRCHSKYRKAMEKTSKKKKLYAGLEVPQAEHRTAGGEAWKCQVCGYVYEGKLPGDFICPYCEQPSSEFEKIG